MSRVTVVQLSDTHLVADPNGVVSGRKTQDRLVSVLAAVRERVARPDLVLLTGDNADDASIEACRRLRDTVSELGAPQFAIAGNHDLAAPVAATFGGAGHTEVGAWRIVGLDSAVPGQIAGRVDAEAALDRIDALDGRPTIVAVHHPPRSNSTHHWFVLDGAEALLEGLADRPHVVAVVSGHVHEAFELAGPRQLRLLGAPSTFVAFRHRGDEFEIGDVGPTGARLLHLHDDASLTTELIEA